jgi:hypothetical protein
MGKGERTRKEGPITHLRYELLSLKRKGTHYLNEGRKSQSGN